MTPDFGTGDRPADVADPAWISAGNGEEYDHLQVRGPANGNTCTTSSIPPDPVGALREGVSFRGYADDGLTEPNASSTIKVNRTDGPCRAASTGEPYPASDLRDVGTLRGMSAFVDQKVTLRHAEGSRRMSLELYGAPMDAQVEPTVTTSEGQAFVFDKAGVLVDAVMLSRTTNQMVVRFDDIRYNGVPVCTTGTYTLVPE